VVEAEPVCDPAAAIVAGQQEARKAEPAHHRGLVGRHRTLRITVAARAAIGLVGIAVPAQIGAHDRVPLGEPGSDRVPHRVRLRVAVQQQERWTAAADDQGDVGAVAGNATRLESRKQILIGWAHQRSLGQQRPPSR
jgi:hypothetical protein